LAWAARRGGSCTGTGRAAPLFTADRIVLVGVTIIVLGRNPTKEIDR
jgi:hypothetical protein